MEKKIEFKAFTLGIVNGICREILASKHKTTSLPSLVLVKSFTIVLKWTSKYTSYCSPIVNLNFIFLLGNIYYFIETNIRLYIILLDSIYYFNELNREIKVEMLGVL